MHIEQEVRGEAYRLGEGQHKNQCPSCSHSRKKKNDKTLSLRIEQDKTCISVGTVVSKVLFLCERSYQRSRENQQCPLQKKFKEKN